jgi:hypothetical protein
LQRAIDGVVRQTMFIVVMPKIFVVLARDSGENYPE